MNAASARLTDAEYDALLRLRTGLRRFLHWSAARAKEAGLTPSQHQLLLVVRALGGDPTIGDVADQLLLRHHSAVELVNRAVVAGLVERDRDARDQRIARLRLSAEGARRLESLAAQHRDELERLRPQMREIWQGLDEVSSTS